MNWLLRQRKMLSICWVFLSIALVLLITTNILNTSSSSSSSSKEEDVNVMIPYAVMRPESGPDDSCGYARDGSCDEPHNCVAGTDCTDCKNCRQDVVQTTKPKKEHKKH